MSTTSYKGSAYPHRRCRTTVNRRPRRSCGSCTMDYIRQLQEENMEEEGNVEDTLNILGIQRSRSDFEIKVKSKESLSGKSLVREKSQVYVTHAADHIHKENTVLSNREEIKAALTTIPKKGMIHLMSGAHEVQGRKEEANTAIQGGRRMHHFGNNQLIRDRKMIEHIKAGRKLLKETETKRTTDEEISKGLGEYTIRDLQLKIMELTVIKELTPTRRTLEDTAGGFRATVLNQTQPVPGSVKPSKKIVLPAISMVTPY
ncbi:hypothetical protein CHS0354_023278 [Potamilus streckersoni]|uniref:Uncharacterized protein n=1 Tax=Potamilus streckersoni TaxID=2493646 RepID=A0AAE0T4N0_9BIVA|nr:hypothetical protein CHS0354_023278 [Potamilus streckersoni]